MDLPTQTVARLPWNNALINDGRGADTVAQMTADAPATVDPRALPDARVNIVLLYPGLNDPMKGATPQDLLALVRAYCEARRAAGFKVCVLTVLPCATPALDAARRSFNLLLRSAWPEFADELVDLTASNIIGKPGASFDHTYYADRTHLSDRGVEIAAIVIAPRLKTMIEASAPRPEAAGYSFVLDRAPDTVPDTTIDAAGPAAGFGGLGDGVWYFHVRAVGGDGTGSSTLTRALRVDTSPPETFSTPSLTWRYGKIKRLAFTIADTVPGSPSAVVRITITDRFGRRAARFVLPDIPVNVELTEMLPCPLPRGVYSLTISTTDAAGNRQTVPTVGRIVVR